MTTTCWLIGSYENFPAQTFAVIDELAASEDQTVATGDYYLRDSSAGISLLQQVENAINAHSNIADGQVDMTVSGKIRIWRTGAANFGITWGSATTLRDMLGFTGNLTGAATYTASNKSDWWWSPLRQESSRVAIIGADGEKVSDAVTGMAGDATMRVTEFNTYRRNEFWWRYVPLARVWTTSEAGGEFFSFWDAVLRPGARFKLWRRITEDSSDNTTIASFGSVLGPYKATERNWSYRQEIQNVDSRSPIEIPCIEVTEYS